MAITTIPTVAVVVRFRDQAGLPVAFAPITAKLTARVIYHGMLVADTVSAQTDFHGLAVVRVFPNTLSAIPSQYKFTMTNPGTGQTVVVYATVPQRDVFLDELGLSVDDSGAAIGGNVAATIGIGTVTSGASPSVTNSGTAKDAVLDFVLPYTPPALYYRDPEPVGYAPAITLNCLNADTFDITLRGPITLTPANARNGQRILLRIAQDATGGRTVTFGANVAQAGSATPYAHTGTPNSIDLIGLIYHGPTGRYLVASYLRGF